MPEDPARESRHKVQRQILIAIGIFAAVVFIATMAYVLDGWKLGDAFYMVIITAFGVGFGEVEPVNTVAARTITILTILGGNSATVYVIGSILKVITEGEMQKVMSDHRKQKNLSELKGHTIICGFGRIGQTVAHELAKADKPFIVIDRDTERVKMAEDHGYLTIEGDGGDEEILERANISRAHTLAAVLPNDMVNVFITLTSRNMSATLRIIGRAEAPATEKKLRQAGANEVIMPALSGGLQIAHRITRPTLMGVLNDSSQLLRFDLQELGVDLDQVDISASHPLVRHPLSELVAANQGRLLVLAVQKKNGEVHQNPRNEVILEEGDRLITILRK